MNDDAAKERAFQQGLDELAEQRYRELHLAGAPRDVSAYVPQTPLVEQLGGWGVVGEPETGNYFQLFEIAVSDPQELAAICERMGGFLDAACRRGIAYPGSGNEPSLMGGIGNRDPNTLRLVRPSYGGAPWTVKTLANGYVAVSGFFSLAQKESL